MTSGRARPLRASSSSSANTARVDPSAVMGLVGAPELASVGEEIGGKLRRVLDACRA
jgi:hypothetical protein